MTERDDRGRYASNRRMNARIRRAAGIRADEPADKAEEVQPSPHGSWDGGARKTLPAPVDMNEWLREALWQ